MGFVRQRDIMQKQKAIKSIQQQIDELDRFGTLSEECAKILEGLEGARASAQQELRQMQKQYKEYEALFAR